MLSVSLNTVGRAAGVDVSQLYTDSAERLERIVRVIVRAPQDDVEDACMAAWSRLIDHRQRVAPEAALSWLVRTAEREAIRLIGRRQREVAVDLDAEPAAFCLPPARGPEPHERLEHQQQLATLRDLPERQQRLLWLHAFGLSYEEIAAREGCTRRTVERQLGKAKQALRERYV